MNQQQLRYFLERIEQEKQRKLKAMPSTFDGPFWDKDEELLQRVAGGMLNWAKSVYPWLEGAEISVDAGQTTSYYRAYLNFSVGPTRAEKERLRYEDKFKDARQRVVDESRRISDAFMLGDAESALRALEEFTNQQF